MISKPLAHHLRAIAEQREHLDWPSPIHLGAFVYGYKLVVPDVSWLDDALQLHFAGPDQARAWTRSYLASGNELGLVRLLEVAIALLEDPASPVVNVGPGEPEWFVNVVSSAVRVKRPGIVLGECTVPWLHNFGLGAQAATADHYPEVAREREAHLVRFESWIQGSFQLPGVPWQRILRAFYGPGEQGVYAFTNLWDEHLRELEPL